MKPWEFAFVCRKDSLGVVHFPYHNRHKVELENIVSNVGLKIEYGKEIEKPKDMASFKTVGNKQHIQIVSLYADEGKG